MKKNQNSRYYTLASNAFTLVTRQSLVMDLWEALPPQMQGRALDMHSPAEPGNEKRET